jgi:hypothetical protein
MQYRGRIAMRPYPFTIFHAFNPNKTHPNPSFAVGAHGNAPDDQLRRNPAIESQFSEKHNCLDRL